MAAVGEEEGGEGGGEHNVADVVGERRAEERGVGVDGVVEGVEGDDEEEAAGDVVDKAEDEAGEEELEVGS